MGGVCELAVEVEDAEGRNRCRHQLTLAPDRSHQVARRKHRAVGNRVIEQRRAVSAHFDTRMARARPSQFAIEPRFLNPHFAQVPSPGRRPQCHVRLGLGVEVAVAHAGLATADFNEAIAEAIEAR